MKKLIMAAMLFVVTGCNHTPDVWRTGNICVPAPVVSDYKTNDFVSVRPDLVALIAGELTKDIKSQLASESKLQVTECGQSEYQLTTIFTLINIESRHYASGWTGQRSNLNRYELEMGWSLRKNGNSELSDNVEKAGTNISEIVQTMSEKIVDHVKILEKE